MRIQKNDKIGEAETKRSRVEISTAIIRALRFPMDDQRKKSMNQLVIDFASGGIALSTAFAAMHPLDTLKTQVQCGQPVQIRNLFRGMVSSVAFSAPQGGLRLATYELSKKLLTSSGESPSLPGVVVSALVGDFCSSIVKVPRENITTRLQTTGSASAHSVISDILAKDGWRGLFRGYLSVTMRDSPFMIILFSSYEKLKRNFDSKYAVLYGGVSGGAAAFVTTPFDVIKTTIMAEVRESAKVSRRSVPKMDPALFASRIFSAKYSTVNAHAGGRKQMSQVAAAIYRQSGFQGFWLGAVPRSVWWFAVCSIFFPVYEECRAGMPNLISK